MNYILFLFIVYSFNGSTLTETVQVPVKTLILCNKSNDIMSKEILLDQDTAIPISIQVSGKCIQVKGNK